MQSKIDYLKRLIEQCQREAAVKRWQGDERTAAAYERIAQDAEDDLALLQPLRLALYDAIEAQAPQSFAAFRKRGHVLTRHAYQAA